MTFERSDGVSRDKRRLVAALLFYSYVASSESIALKWR